MSKNISSINEMTYVKDKISTIKFKSRGGSLGYGSLFTIISRTARNPRPFKGGDEWPPVAKPAIAGGAEAIYGIIWRWPDIGRESIQSIDCSITWCGHQSIASETVGKIDEAVIRKYIDGQ